MKDLETLSARFLWSGDWVGLGFLEPFSQIERSCRRQRASLAEKVLADVLQAIVSKGAIFILLHIAYLSVVSRSVRKREDLRKDTTKGEFSIEGRAV